MLTRRIIPCLDVRDGRVVKGVRFSGLRDAGDPVELAARYEAEGADEIVILDVAATPDQRQTCCETVARVRASISIPLSVGGGVRALVDAERLLSVGADKVALNTAAVRRPEILRELADRTGRQCVVLAVDAVQWAHGWRVAVRSGAEHTELDAVEWAGVGEALGVGEVLLTSWDRDGTGDGYDIALLRAVASRVRVPIIASGGAKGPAHMIEAFEAGADAVLAASIFHDAAMSIGEVKDALAERGVEVRR